MDSGKQIYFDHNATTPLDSTVMDRVVDWLADWGNASSIHWAGRGPKALLREARRQIATLLGVHPLELIFTAGGSESNNLAIKGVFDSLFTHGHVRETDPRPQFILSAVEHPSVHKAMWDLQHLGAQIDTVPVHRDGTVDLETFENLVSERTALVSVMLANNETGSLLPIKKMTKIARERGALFHCDAVQALGKIPLNVPSLGADLVSFSGHKFYALKGAGVLYCRRGVSLQAQIKGGGQERHRRGGTENVLAIASLGAMCERGDEIISHAETMRTLRDWMEAEIEKQISGVTFNGRAVKRLPNTSSLVVSGMDGETLLMALDLLGFAISTGAACSSGAAEPSPVLRAMGLSREEAQSSLRISLGWQTTVNDVRGLVTALKHVVDRLRQTSRSLEVRHGL